MNGLYSIEAEEALIGAVLLGNIHPSTINIEPDDFYIDRHKYVWKALLRVQYSKKAIDIVTVAAELDKTGELQEVGGQSELARFMTAQGAHFNAPSYAETVSERAEQRRLKFVLEDFANDVASGEYDVGDMYDRLNKAKRTKGEAKHLSHALHSMMSEVEERAKDPKDVWGIPTGYVDLDRMTGGLHLQQTMYLSAPPGMGKSLLATQIAKNISETEGVAIFSFEMRAERLMKRIISAETGVPTRAMNTGHMEEHWDKFYKGVDDSETLKLYISDIYGMTTSDLRAEVSRLKALYNIKVIVVDYLNLLTDTGGEKEHITTAIKAKRMQSVCREMNVAGIIIQSMVKEGWGEKVPTLSRMAGSSDVGHTGDMVFLLAKDPDQSNIVKLLPAKLRDGDMGTKAINLTWIKGLPKLESAYNPSIF